MKQSHGDLDSSRKTPANKLKSEVPIAQIKFSNSLLKFRSTEGTPGGSIQPLSSITSMLKDTSNSTRKSSAENVKHENQGPPLKKLKLEELSQTVKPTAGMVTKPTLPSSNGKTTPLLEPLLACSLCPFRRVPVIDDHVQVFQGFYITLPFQDCDRSSVPRPRGQGAQANGWKQKI